MGIFIEKIRNFTLTVFKAKAKQRKKRKKKIEHQGEENKGNKRNMKNIRQNSLRRKN